jgi:hypothetical protein
MKKNQLLKKLDEKITKLYDHLYDIKNLLDQTEDTDIEYMADEFVEQLETCINDGDPSIEQIKEHIEMYYE